MPEIFRGTSQKVLLDVYGAPTTVNPTAQLFVGDSTTPIALTPQSEEVTGSEAEKWSVYIGLQYTIYDTTLRIIWSVTMGSESTVIEHVYDVVTAFASLDEIKDNITVPTGVSDTQLLRLERRIRLIIQGICRQKFGKESGDKVVLGRGEKQVPLPNRLVSFTSVVGPYTLDSTAYATRADGWWLEIVPTAPDGDIVFTTVIAVPETAYGGFTDDIPYTITGVWGYNNVPDAIKEATLLLIENSLCPDSEYVNRYIEDVSFGDSSYSFNPAAFSGTGNNDADALISHYIRMNFTVI
jgi:hypothetical protein